MCEWRQVHEDCPENEEQVLLHTADDKYYLGTMIYLPWYGSEWAVYIANTGEYPLDVVEFMRFKK